MLKSLQENRARKLWLILIAALVILYILNFFAPLRLTHDTVRYFILQEKFRGVWPDSIPVSTDFLPYGYVYFLAGLGSLHMLNAASIALIQFLYLCGSLFFITALFPGINRLRVVALSLLSWLTIKFTVVPLSEMQFLFFSSGGLYFYRKFELGRRWIHFLYCLGFCTLAILTRSAGLVLLPAIGYSFVALFRNQLRDRLHQYGRAAIVLSLAGLLAVLFWEWSTIKAYLQFWAGPLLKDPLQFLFNNLYWHLAEWGELLINVPLSKLEQLIHSPVTHWAYLAAGTAGVYFFVKGIFSKKKQLAPVIRLYLLLYSVLILVWPYYEARFWFPVLPFVICIFAGRIQVNRDFWLRAGRLAVLSYAGVGAFAVGYYCYLSFSHAAMAQRQDAGIWTKEYQALFSGRREIPNDANASAFYILRKYR